MMARKMKESGIKWLGTIPVEWETRKIKYSLKERIEKNNPIKTEEILSLTAKQGVIPHSEKDGGGNKPKEDLSAYRLAYPGDIVMNSMNILSGSVGLSKYFGCVSPVYYMLYPNNKNEDVRYYNYIFQATVFQRSLFGLGNGILIKESGNGKLNTIRMRIPMDKLGNIIIPIATINEQKKISDYLDKRCREIDALSLDIQSQINILDDYKKSVIAETVTKGLNPNVKMKESRIAWVNTAPIHWTISKIKYEIVPLQRSVRSDDLVMTCFRDGKVTLRQNRREDGYTISFTENGYQGVEVGDLVIHGMDAFAGAIGCSDSRGKITPVVHVCKTTGNNRFFMYMLRSMARNDVFMNYAEGIRVRSSDFRNFNKLGKFPIIVPPINEQNEIVSYLDDRCEKIDAIIAQKKEQLLVIVDYKKSLIYEYVTGKREVPDNNG